MRAAVIGQGTGARRNARHAAREGKQDLTMTTVDSSLTVASGLTSEEAALRNRAGRVAHAMSRVPSWVLLAALAATIAAINVSWRLLDARPPLWDMSYHLSNSLFYLHGASLSDPLAFVGAYRYYPPLTYWVTDVFYAALGSEAMWVAVLSNVVWVAVLVLATFGVGRRLWSARVGWVAVVFVVTAPIIVAASKQYELDMPLTAVAALTLYLLIRADGFSSRRYSLLLGATVGCGLLVKWTFPLVILVPVLYAFLNALAKARLRQFYPLLNAVLAAELVLVIAGPWYVANFRQVGAAGQRYNSPEMLNPGSTTPASALWYLWGLLNSKLYLMPTVMLLVGIAFCFRRREYAARNLYPILMVVGTYLMFSLLPNKAPRFTEPMIPALGVIATGWLHYVSLRARTWITTGFVTYGAITFLAVSFGTSLLPTSFGFNLPATRFNPSRVTLFGQAWPTNEDWHVADPFKTMASFPRSERSFSYKGPNTIWFNAMGLYYYESRYGAHRADAASARFLLDRSRPARTTPTSYRPLERWRLPDGDTLVLYRRLVAGISHPARPELALLDPQVAREGARGVRRRPQAARERSQPPAAPPTGQARPRHEP